MRSLKPELDGFGYFEQAGKQEGKGHVLPSFPVKFRYVGQRIPRVDSRLIVTGKAQFTQDLYFERMLYGKILRSSYPAAEIINIDFSAALSHLGVTATIKLTTGRIRYFGEPVAAIDARKEAGSLGENGYKVDLAEVLLARAALSLLS